MGKVMVSEADKAYNSIVEWIEKVLPSWLHYYYVEKNQLYGIIFHYMFNNKIDKLEIPLEEIQYLSDEGYYVLVTPKKIDEYGEDIPANYTILVELKKVEEKENE